MIQTISQQMINDKNNEFFLIISNIELTLNEEDLSRILIKLERALKLLPQKGDLKKRLKITYRSLHSILSALKRVDQEILQQDLNNCEKDLLGIFEEFKINTGIYRVEKKKKKKQVSLTSLEQLGELNEMKKDTFESSSKPSFLRTMQSQIHRELNKGQETLTLISPILVVGFIENFNRLPYYNIIMENSNYGILWRNCHLVATTNPNFTKEDAENLLEEEFNEGFTCLFDSIKVKAFPNHRFFWAVQTKLAKELGVNKLRSWTLPLSSSSSFLNASKERAEELRKLRLEMEAQKKKGPKNEFKD